MDSGSIGHAKYHTKSLPKSTSQKATIFKMASQMAAGSLELLYLKWKKMLQRIFQLILVPLDMLKNILQI